jgi:hypothetical protein
MHYLRFILLLLVLIPAGLFSQSEWIGIETNHQLIYKTSDRGDKIMDFSHAGYRGGGVALPDVPVKKTVNRISGISDYTDLIQEAIDEVSALPLIEGFRGTVLLAPGKYPCSRTLTIKKDGVVLRGSGTDSKESVIVMQGDKHTAIVLNNEISRGTGNRLGTVDTNKFSFKITDDYIPAGASSFTVENALGLASGDNIEICKPVTEKWIQFMEMDNLVRDGKPQTWIKEGSYIITERVVAAIDGNRITLTVPLADSYNSRFTDGNTIGVVANNVKRLKNAGVENLQIESPHQAVNHSDALYYALNIQGEDCWARDIDCIETMESVRIGGRKITLERVNVIRKALHEGASKPAEFAPNGGQVLVKDCSVEGDNIWFVAVGAGQTGPIVFLNCTFKGNGRIEGHQRWSTGMLFDNCILPDGGIDFKNRGSMGSGHGWGTAWSVAWNCKAKNYVNQLPPGTYNWVIGSTGERMRLPRPFDKEGLLPEGIFDSHGTPVSPKSLYLAQLKERLGEDAIISILY